VGRYDTQQVCLNGHQITDRYQGAPQFRRSYCDKCGAGTIHKCPVCSAEIKGDYITEGIVAIGFSTPVPTFCENCGKAFPWAEKLHQTAEAAKGELGDVMTLLEVVCSRFHLTVKQLRERHDKRQTLDVTDEYDVQDLLHALLVLFFDDVRPEEYTPSYAGKSTRMDFLLRGESVVVEAKMTRPNLGAKEVGEQLIVDIAHYQSHPACRRLVCLVYDPQGRISNPRGLEGDLSKKHGELEVKVFVVPKGY